MARDFPVQPWWAAYVIHPDDEQKFGAEPFYSYYRTKYELAKRCAPRDICEIGVRWGYSAWAFLAAAPEASYSGFDRQAGTHGGVKGVNTFGYVETLLQRDFSGVCVCLHEADTRQCRTLAGFYDFIHIDGDHSEDGCRHDLELALKACHAGGSILVDDYDYIAGVRRAVDGFVACHADRFSSQLHVPGLRGEYLITTKGGA